MNTIDLGVFLPLMVAVAVAFVLFLISSGSILMALETRPCASKTQTVTTDIEERRKLPVRPNIICMLPMHEEKRPEQRLW
jgi:hypothetical protein